MEISSFEAEGAPENVQRQFESFKEMVAAVPRQAVVPTVTSNSNSNQNEQQNQGSAKHGEHVPLEKIMNVSGRVVSLTAIPPMVEGAALLIMLGQKDLRGNLTVTGQEIGDGLDLSGRSVLRVDRVMEKTIKENLVLKTGFKRSTRYRLTNQGLSAALKIARELMDSLP